MFKQSKLTLYCFWNFKRFQQIRDVIIFVLKKLNHFSFMIDHLCNVFQKHDVQIFTTIQRSSPLKFKIYLNATKSLIYLASCLSFIISIISCTTQPLSSVLRLFFDSSTSLKLIWCSQSQHDHCQNRIQCNIGRWKRRQESKEGRWEEGCRCP